VTFDTAASESVFENPNLLTNVAPSGYPTMKVPQEYASTTWETSATSVKSAWRKGLACNIIFACQMLDTGMTFKYDDTNDKFIVCGPI